MNDFALTFNRIYISLWGSVLLPMRIAGVSPESGARFPLARTDNSSAFFFFLVLNYYLWNAIGMRACVPFWAPLRYSAAMFLSTPETRFDPFRVSL